MARLGGAGDGMGYCKITTEDGTWNFRHSSLNHKSFDLRETYDVGEVADRGQGPVVITYISSVVYNYPLSVSVITSPIEISR